MPACLDDPEDTAPKPIVISPAGESDPVLTTNLRAGAVVPIPTLPLASTNNRPVPPVEMASWSAPG